MTANVLLRNKLCYINIKLICLFVLAVVSLAACQSKQNTVIEDKLSKIETGQSFSLDTLKEGNWNAFCVITPYYNIDSLSNLNIVIDEDIRKELSKLVMLDGINTLLFLNNEAVVGLESVSRAVADFSLMNDSSKLLFLRLDVFKIKDSRVIQYLKETDQ